MKCPKCGYLGFETGDRCRNCGYDFSLPPLPGGELDGDPLLQTVTPEDGPLLDLSLRREFEDTDDDRPTRTRDHLLDLDRLIGEPEPAAPSVPAVSTASTDEFSLSPTGSNLDDRGLRALRRISRPPLAVRRATPEIPRVRPRLSPRAVRAFEDVEAPLFGLGLTSDTTNGQLSHVTDAPPARRAAATALDLLVLGAVNVVVVYLTLRLSGLHVTDVGQLPRIPLASFLLILNGGYFTTFAAVGGQTIGQMALGLKVIGHDGAPVAFATATIRTLAWLLFTLPLGLDLWFAFGTSRQTLHDRITATHVVSC